MSVAYMINIIYAFIYNLIIICYIYIHYIDNYKCIITYIYIYICIHIINDINIYLYLYIWQRQLNMWRAGQTVSGPGGSIKYQFVYWNVVTVYMYYTTGWWLAFISPYTYWECHHPNWRTHISQRGRSSTNQILYANIYIYTILYMYYTIIHTICTICSLYIYWAGGSHRSGQAQARASSPLGGR